MRDELRDRLMRNERPDSEIRPGPVRRFYNSKTANIDHRYDCASVSWEWWGQTTDDMTGKRPCKLCNPSEKDEGPLCDFCSAYPAYGVGSPLVFKYGRRRGWWICKICLSPEVTLLLGLRWQIEEIWKHVQDIEEQERVRQIRERKKQLEQWEQRELLEQRVEQRVQREQRERRERREQQRARQ